MLWKLLALGLLCLVHIVGHRIRPRDGSAEAMWLSFGSGVSVAYVFLMLLPELADKAEERAHLVVGWVQPLYDHPHFVALLGLLLFYGVGRAFRASERQGRASDELQRSRFLFDIGSFVLYNLSIGHVLADHVVDTQLLWYTVAMALHFQVTDRGLLDEYPELYPRIGRWLVALALVVGFGLTSTTTLLDPLSPLITAFLGGGVILNTLQEELEESRTSELRSFVVGTLVYAVILVFVG